MASKKTDEAKLDKLAGLLRELPPEQVRGLLRKDQIVRLRVTKRAKTEIEAEAKRRGMSASAYLLHLHEEAMKRG